MNSQINIKELNSAIQTLCDCWYSDERDNVMENAEMMSKTNRGRDGFTDYVSTTCWYALEVVSHKGDMTLVNASIDELYKECCDNGDWNGKEYCCDDCNDEFDSDDKQKCLNSCRCFECACDAGCDCVVCKVERERRIEEEPDCCEKWISKIEWNISSVNTKPYSHNIISISLNALKSQCSWTDEKVDEIIVKYGLDKLGWKVSTPTTIIIKKKKVKKVAVKKPLIIIESDSDDDAEEKQEKVMECNTLPVLSNAEVIIESPVVKEPTKFCMGSGCFDKDFYENYIKDRLSKSVLKHFQRAFDEFPDEFMEYYSMGFTAKYQKEWEYSEILWCDVGGDEIKQGKMIPVVFVNVNTSSATAMVRCCMNRDLDDGEEEDWRTLEDILDYCPTPGMADVIRKLLE